MQIHSVFGRKLFINLFLVRVKNVSSEHTNDVEEVLAVLNSGFQVVRFYKLGENIVVLINALDNQLFQFVNGVGIGLRPNAVNLQYGIVKRFGK